MTGGYRLAGGDEAERVLSHLASMPGVAHSSVTRKVLQELLLATDGEMLLAGHLYAIKSRHLGAGVYSVTTERKP